MATAQYLTIRDAWLETGFDEKFIRDAARRGQLPAVRFSDSPRAPFYVDRIDLYQWAGRMKSRHLRSV